MFLPDRTQDVGSQLEQYRGAAVSSSRPRPWGHMASACPSVMTAADTQPVWCPVSPLHCYLVWKWKRMLQGLTWCFSLKCPPIFLIHWWVLHDPNFILIFEKVLTFQVCRNLHIFLLAHDILLQRSWPFLLFSLFAYLLTYLFPMCTREFGAQGRICSEINE